MTEDLATLAHEGSGCVVSMLVRYINARSGRRVEIARAKKAASGPRPRCGMKPVRAADTQPKVEAVHVVAY